MIVAGAVAACASVPPRDTAAHRDYVARNDPLEPVNRYFFEVNRGLDELFLKPASAAYDAGLPDRVQDSVRSFLRNLSTPLILANDLLQGEGERAEVTLSRFLVNTSIGLLGVFDVASEIGLEYHDEDFGQTMAVAGIPEGPYLMLPLLGPSNPRDLFGRAVEWLADPVGYVVGPNAQVARTGVTAVDARNRNGKTIDALQQQSIDFYAAIREAYRQRRRDEVRNRPTGDDTTGPGVVFEDDGAF